MSQTEMDTDKVTNILVVGVGGQGVMTAAEVLAQAALALGLDVKKTEIAGMAQRGGTVTSHVRFGPRVLAPAIPAGEADILMAFEAAEAIRWENHVRPGGLIAVNTLRLAPPVVESGIFPYPDDPVGMLRAAGREPRVLDADAIARELGDVRLSNSIMLGAIADSLPFAADRLKEIIVARFAAKKKELGALNAQAFDAGCKAARAAQTAA